MNGPSGRRLAGAVAGVRGEFAGGRERPEPLRREEVAEASDLIATHLGIPADQLYFVGDGRLAHTLAFAGLPPSPRAVSAIERAEILAQATLTLPVSPSGHLRQLDLASAKGNFEKGNFSVGWVNGEIGTIQEISALAEEIHEVGGYLHSDLSFGLGALPVPTGWDVASIDARAFGGPTLGIMAIKSRTRWSNPLPTLSPQFDHIQADERLIIEAASTLAGYAEKAKENSARIAHFNATLRSRCAQLTHIDVAGDSTGIPHIITFSVLYAQGEELVRAFAVQGFHVASGSACMSANLEPSHVLSATGKLTHGNVRLTIPYDEPHTSLNHFLEVLPQVIEGVRQS